MRVVGSNRDDTWHRIRTAGVDLLFDCGYDSMNTRQLAEAANLKPGSLYYHFSSKEEFLYRLLVDLLEEILAELEEALDAADDNQTARLDTFVRVLVKWHVARHKETFIASIETRALSRERHESYLRLRDRFDTTLDDILSAGKESGEFDILDPMPTRSSILSMITAISGWYNPTGTLHLDDITAAYLGIARRIVGRRDHPADG